MDYTEIEIQFFFDASRVVFTIPTWQVAQMIDEGQPIKDLRKIGVVLNFKTFKK